MNGSPNRYAIYSDEELMQFILQGKVEAFDELYSRFSRPMMAYFYRMLNYDKILAEDALQDLFLKIAENPSRFDSSRSFKTWIFSVASNYCKNYYRHQKVIKENYSSLNYELNEHHDSLAGLISKIDRIYFAELLDRLLKELPFEKKEAFILKYQEEKTISEIALIQQCSEGTVKSRIFYAVKLLEEKIQTVKPEIQNGNAK